MDETDTNTKQIQVVQPTESTTTIHSTSYTTRTVSVTPSKPADVLPTPIVTVFPTPGTYTIPKTTITVTSETTVCGATSTSVTPGTHTWGGTTTVVKTSTTVVCPIATVSPTGSTYTSTIITTTHVCPSAGTYTIGQTTSKVDKPTVIVYPTPATYTPGTYTQPEQVVTATETDYVYVCPTAEASAPPAYSPAPKPKPEPEEKPSGNGGRYGVTYSPYTGDSQCKDSKTIADDIAKIALGGFQVVRIYAPDCNALEAVGNACKAKGMKMIVGVFNDDIENQVQQICQWAQWDLVSLITVGNEAIHGGVMDAGTLAGLIKSAKKSFVAAGYKGHVTTAEPLNVWQENKGQLCGACDITGANIHPFFNAEVSPSDAGKFISGQIDILKNLCGKDVINLETGWPSKGSANGAAVPGVTEQAKAITSILTTKGVGDCSVLLSFENDMWKNPGPFGCEQFWGFVPSLLDGAVSSALKAAGDIVDKVGDVVDGVADAVNNVADNL